MTDLRKELEELLSEAHLRGWRGTPDEARIPLYSGAKLALRAALEDSPHKVADVPGVDERYKDGWLGCAKEWEVRIESLLDSLEEQDDS